MLSKYVGERQLCQVDRKWYEVLDKTTRRNCVTVSLNGDLFFGSEDQSQEEFLKRLLNEGILLPSYDPPQEDVLPGECR
ncbi:hypothetical protein COT97_02810 [Candidatus Falkowbacteria bacterium CG10_big_fil_rev_8_21_14_0_10_39_11]|uniref:Uncharacterized protein n=1 Tax=Candidatus Falkowbacteria bacterium CG10_big_fil_rev_8_21_14_0_10_39_11 TaxID=1974565 RepID=A0A2H0V4Z7_9BACT|nr:MAG: hypothetical protein COT97_02810 [Candidatus Falkowbacteria bacterium CG10_big_fil_rev_8_21_14_0_10_39_11]